MKYFFAMAFAFLFGLAAEGKENHSSEQTARPNVVLIFADDLGYGDLGCYGATKVQTPNIDRLAKEGRRFTDAHSASAVCTPSRYAMLTGEYPFRQGTRGAWGPLSHRSGLIVDTNKATLGKVFKNAGYQTACVGKWHLGFGTTPCDWNKPLRPGPADVGFDYYFGIPKVNSGPPYVYVENDRIVGWDANDPMVEKKKPASPTPLFPEKKENIFGGALKAHQLYDDEKTGTLVTEKAVEWIQDNHENPFFLYFPTPNIHHPFTPAKRFQGTSECGRYGDFIHELDWMVGRLLTTLDDLKLTETTLVVFASDNGGMFNDGGKDAWKAGHTLNGDLLGFKFGAWEGGHRVPFIARWPSRIPAGSTSDQLICNIDMVATFAGLFDQELNATDAVDSLDVMEAMIGSPEVPIRDSLVLAPFKQSNLSLREGDWMYISGQGDGGFGNDRGGPQAVALSKRPNSDITPNGRIRKDAPKAQLYDLKSDPAQQTNVIRDNVRRAAKMRERLQEIRQGKATRLVPEPVAIHKPVSATNDTPRAPNFVVIFTDDQGYADLSCFGGEHVNTPRIDQMAAEGMRLTSFYVAAPVCTPSRAALMTGCYPKRVDMATGSNFGVLLAGDTKGLHPNEITIAEVLKSAGYKTGMFGKWHLGDQPDFLPTKQGFDEYFGIPYSHDIHPFHPAQRKHQFPALPLLDGDDVIEMDPDANLLTRRVTQRAVDFIKANRGQPFFLYVPHPIPHRPLHVSEPFMKDVSPELLARLAGEAEGSVDYKTRDKLFRQAINEIDWSVGQILDTLKSQGIDKDTLVLFTSDNGPAVGKATPLRGKKGQTFEGGMREPAVIRWPGKIPAGKANDQLMTTMDLLPTFAKLAGARVPSDRVIDGKDIWPILAENEKSTRSAFFYHKGNDLQAVRSGKWKLHVAGAASPALYDLDNDIGERNDVLESHPDVAKRLRGYVADFQTELARNSRAAAFVENPRPLSMSAE